MRSFYYIFSFVLIGASCGSVNHLSNKEGIEYELVGNIPSIPNGTFLTLINDITREEEISLVTDGKFSFRGTAKEPFYADLSILNEHYIESMPGNKYGTNFFVGQGTIQLSGAFNEIIITGSNINDENAEFLENEAVDFYKKYPDSYVTAHYLKYDAFFNQLPRTEIQEIYNSLSDRIKQSTNGLIIERYASLPEMPKVGEKYSDFELFTTEGIPLKISEIKSRYILIDFWASWCGPCRDQNPDLISIYEEFNNKGLEIIGVSLDENPEKWKNAIAKDQLPWINLAGEGTRFMYPCQLYRINSIPDNILINEEGIIIGRNLSLGALKKLLEEGLS